MDRFQLDLDETLSVGVDLEEDFASHLDVAPFRNGSGQDILLDTSDDPWWTTCWGEPGNLFDRGPRHRRAA